LDAQAIVFECMAVDPDLQRIAEERIMASTITVITNARLDHTDVQGSDPTEIAKSFAVRPGATLITADPLVVATHRHRLERSGGRLIVTGPNDVVPWELHRMEYVEHPENAALALAVAEELGIPRALAMRGIVATAPDPGAAGVLDLTDAAGNWSLVNLFAANDPASTFQALDTVRERFGELGDPLLLFSARGDRTARSAEFAAALLEHRDHFRHVVVFGERTRAMTRCALRHGVDAGWITNAGNPSPADLTDLLMARLADEPDAGRAVVGVGNIIGPAQTWLEHLGALAPSEDAETPLEDVA
jgi:poly-gamma-glutamate synthase PgsB/CapB